MISLLASASAADLLLPHDYTTVQDGVDAASNGDHIIVTISQDGLVVIDGVDVALHGIGKNDEVLTAGSDPVVEVIGNADVVMQALTLDGEGSRRGLRMSGSGNTVDRVGVKISNGHSTDHGGGVRAVDGRLDLFDSILYDNQTTGDGKHGGTVFLEIAAVFTSTRTVFKDSTTNEEQGGAVFSDNADTTFGYSTLALNRADKGSAVLAKDGPVAMSNSIVSDNEDDKNSNSQALRAEGGGSNFTGGNNLYDNNVGDIDTGYMAGDVHGGRHLRRPDRSERHLRDRHLRRLHVHHRRRLRPQRRGRGRGRQRRRWPRRPHRLCPERRHHPPRRHRDGRRRGRPEPRRPRSVPRRRRQRRLPQHVDPLQQHRRLQRQRSLPGGPHRL